MTTQADNISAFAQGVGADVKALTANQGTLSTLTTTAKGSLVAAINEVDSKPSGGATINDTTASTSTVYSSSKTDSQVAAAVGPLVSFGASQTLTAPQQLQACTNIGIGDPTTNFASVYATAKS